MAMSTAKSPASTTCDLGAFDVHSSRTYLRTHSLKVKKKGGGPQSNMLKPLEINVEAASSWAT